MKKKVSIMILIIVMLIIIVSIIFLVVLRKDSNIDTKITMDNLYELEDMIDNKEKISLEYFKNFDLKEKVEEENIITYVYNMNEKYDVRVTTLNNIVTNIVLYNTVILTNVDIMYYSLENFLENE